MKVRELIAALKLQDPEMGVVIPADSELGDQYAILGGAEPDVFAPYVDTGPAGRQLAELSDVGAEVWLRLYGTGVDPQAARFK